MKITTYSGTQYIIKDIVEPSEEATIKLYQANLARLSDHSIINLGRGGGVFDNDPEFHEVVFPALPEVGRSFSYVHPIWDGCISSQVQKIEDDN
jgi:hypothetical protein